VIDLARILRTARLHRDRVHQPPRHRVPTRWAAELDVTDDLEDLLDTTRMTNDD
jgi:hypothetical protein